MSDIVERLRKGIEWTGPTQDDTGQTENLMDEAADEITRLRVEVETLRAARDLVLEEAARCAEGPPRRVSASGEVIYRGDEFYEYATDGSSDYGAGRMDAAAVIRALKEKQ